MKKGLLKIALFCFIWLVTLPAVFGLKVVTWNLENMMDLDSFNNWQKDCALKENANFKPTFLYCDAFSGKDFITKKPAYLPLNRWENFKLKIKALRQASQKIKADVYAIQEVANKKALALIFDETEYDLFVTEGLFVQNLGFAVSKKAGFDSHFRVIDDFEKISLGNDYKGKEALELTLTSSKLAFRMLNIHLKSGCKNYLLDDPKPSKNGFLPGYDLDKACDVLKDQTIFLKVWTKRNNSKNIPFLILGDFNRLFLWEFNQFYRNFQNTRLPSSQSLDVRGDITPKTKLGLMFFEINSDEYGSNRLVMSFPNRKVKKYLGRERCLFGNDYILANQRFLALSGIFKNSVMVDEFETHTYDYGDNNYGLNKALPSDHCPLIADFDL